MSALSAHTKVRYSLTNVARLVKTSAHPVRLFTARGANPCARSIASKGLALVSGYCLGDGPTNRKSTT